jgi:AraC-like DNA-binding protein/ligand-binding sensor protein
MNPVAYDELARMPLLQHYEEAFQKATGVSLRLVPPVDSQPCDAVTDVQDDHPFCALMWSRPAGCAACRATREDLCQAAARQQVAQQVHCFAGLTEIAVPVIIDGRHVATLMSGQVFRKKPTVRDFKAAIKMLGSAVPDENWRKMQKTYFETLVVPPDTLLAIMHLITVFAGHLSDDATRHSIAREEREPRAVSNAKEFVQSHAEEAITLKQVLQHVNANRFHFCKIFKKTTGMTLTEYVARVRVVKAKALLADPSRRISEVVFAAGFGSIPQFNNVFKRFVGMPPSAYRATLRAQPPAGSLPG